MIQHTYYFEPFHPLWTYFIIVRMLIGRALDHTIQDSLPLLSTMQLDEVLIKCDRTQHMLRHHLDRDS